MIEPAARAPDFRGTLEGQFMTSRRFNPVKRQPGNRAVARSAGSFNRSHLILGREPQE